jgi:MFS family permease
MRARLRKTLINRNYARLWYGQAVSSIGNYVFETTLALWVATVLAKKPDNTYATWAPAATSGVFMAAVVAIATVGPLAGVFVDRWDRRRTMMHTESVRAALTLALFALAFIPRQDLPIGVWLAAIYLVVFLLNAAGSFFGPSRTATIAAVVTGDADLAKAAGLGQATDATASMIGPPLAAPLLFVAGFQWALLFNAASFVVSYVAIRSVQVPPKPRPAHPPTRGKFRAEFMEGIRFVMGSRYLVALLGLVLIAQVGAGAINALDVFFVTRNLHVAPKFFGFFATAFGLGAVIGGVISGSAVRRIGAKAVTCLGTVVGGFLLLLYAKQTSFVPGLLVIGVAGVPITALNAAIMPQILRVTPSQYLGRVSAVLNPVSALSSIGSMALAGVLASTALRTFHATVLGIHMGPIDTIFTVSGLLFVAAGLVAIRTLPSDRDDAD